MAECYATSGPMDNGPPGRLGRRREMDEAKGIEGRGGLAMLRRRLLPDERIAELPDLDPGVGAPGGRRLVCAACRHPITSEGHRIEVEGRHAHRRSNPFGVTFDFWCFEAAPGASCLGRPTTEHTWFAGFAWSFALCGGCGEHLGWLFEGRTPLRFYGLVCGRLQVDEDAPPSM